MVALLEVPSLRERVSRVEVESYERMGERTDGRRTELIRGIIIDKMTISPLHSFLVAQLRKAVQGALDDTMDCRQEQPLRLVDSMPEPDLAVVPGNARDYRRVHPKTAWLAIEVAVSSADLDHEKAPLYAEAEVPEYWIVLANEEAVEVYIEPVGGVYAQRRTYRRGETVLCGVLPALRVEVGGAVRGASGISRCLERWLWERIWKRMRNTKLAGTGDSHCRLPFRTDRIQADRRKFGDVGTNDYLTAS